MSGRSHESEVTDLTDFVRESIAAFAQLIVAASRKETFVRIRDCPTYPVAAKTRDVLTAVVQLRRALAHSHSYSSTLLSNLYAVARGWEYRKRRGQFFTPDSVAEWAFTASPPNCTDVV